jgi:DNA-binding SARP family transcriptional activator
VVVERDDERIEQALPGRQGRLLFVYLVANRHRAVPRAELMDALWPEGGPSATDSGLSALLSKLRKAVGADALGGRSTVRLSLGDAWVDLEAAEEAIHRAESAISLGEWARAWAPSLVALFTARRGFLPVEEGAWIDERRRALDELRLRALECYAAAGLGLGGTELAGARRAGRELVTSAPYRESGYRFLMEALAAEGNVAEALRVYDELCTRLRDDMGITPSAPSRELHARLLR